METNKSKGVEAMRLLHKLVDLKRYKDHKGKDDFYQQEQPKLWEQAKAITDADDEDMSKWYDTLPKEQRTAYEMKYQKAGVPIRELYYHSLAHPQQSEGVEESSWPSVNTSDSPEMRKLRGEKPLSPSEPAVGQAEDGVEKKANAYVQKFWAEKSSEVRRIAAMAYCAGYTAKGEPQEAPAFTFSISNQQAEAFQEAMNRPYKVCAIMDNGEQIDITQFMTSKEAVPGFWDNITSLPGRIYKHKAGGPRRPAIATAKGNMELMKDDHTWAEQHYGETVTVIPVPEYYMTVKIDPNTKGGES